MITTVLLDAGGVILDESEHERIRGEIIRDVLSPFVSGYSPDDLSLDLDEAIRSFCPNTYRYVLWKHSNPDKGRYDGLVADFTRLWEQRETPLQLFPGVDAEIRAMAQHLRVGIAGQYGHDLLEILESHGLLDCFCWRYTQDDFKITKPDPRYLLQITAACGVAPEECIMVGDRIDKDVIPAKQVGMKTVRIRTGLHINQEPRIPGEMPDAEIRDISELADAVRRVAKQA